MIRRSKMSSTDRLPLDDEMLAAEFERRANEARLERDAIGREQEELRRRDDELARLEHQLTTMATALRAGLPLPIFWESSPRRPEPKYGRSLPLLLAIVDVLGSETLHRDEIVDRLSSRGFDWQGGDP